MKVYAVLGGPAVGKSTLVRHLTGRWSKGTQPIGLKEGRVLNMFIYPSSPQEHSDPLNPETFIALVEGLETQPEAVVVALRTDVWKGQPTADDFLHAFAAHGWELVAVERLFQGPVNAPPVSVDVDIQHDTPHARSHPSNVLAQKVCDRWGWV